MIAAMTQADWTNFFMAQCGASAALIGLLFVALSINMRRIINTPYLVNRVAEALLIFSSPLTFSVFGLVPHQSVFTFGVEILLSSIAIWAVITLAECRHVRDRPPQATVRTLFVWITQIQSAALAPVVAGALLTTGHQSGFYWLIPATIIAYVGGITNTWVLTVEILR